MASQLPETTYSTLPNGFNVACQHIPQVDFCTIGVWIDAGSRFEDQNNNGVAHFLEHLNFKGTNRFSKAYIDTLFEHLGAHFNAYTSRDRTAYYIKAFNKDVDRVIELLADILCNGRYDNRDIEFERPTILAEMREVEALVDEVIMDNLHLGAYDPLVSGLPFTILGPERNIAKTIDRQMVVDFVNTHYTGPRMNLVASGGLSHMQLEGLASKYFGGMSKENNRPQLTSRYTGGITSMWNPNMMTANLAWALPVCGIKHKDAVTLQLLHTVIGNYGREAQDVSLYQGLNADEKRRQAIGHDVESIKGFFTPYEETSLFGFYAVTLPSSMAPGSDATTNNLISLFQRDLMKLATEPLPVDQLEKAKSAFKAANVLALDSTTNCCENLGQQMIHLGRQRPMPELFDMVDAITPEVLMRTAHKYFCTDTRPTISTVGPPNTLPTTDPRVDLASRLV